MTALGFLILLGGYVLFGGGVPWFAYRCLLRISGHPRLVFGAVVLVGAILGGALSNWTRLTSETLKVTGFPLPLVLFHLEDGHWVDFVYPLQTMLFILLLNCLMMISAVCLVVIVISFLLEARRRSGGKKVAPAFGS